MPTILFSLIMLMAQPAPPPALKAALHASHESVAPGGSTDLAVEIEVTKGWHYYHPILLDTGFPTTVRFVTPPGVTVRDLRWPTPELGSLQGIEYLGYEGKIFVLATLNVDKSIPVGTALEIRADVDGLACIENCIPVKGSAALKLAVSQQAGGPANSKLFEQARGALPPALGRAPYIEGSSIAVSAEKLKIGEQAEIVATIRVRPGHHIQDRDPGVDMLIPSRLFIEPVDGLKIEDPDKWIWPKPHVRDMPGIGKVREQSGEFRIRVPIRIIDSEFKSGPVQMMVLFSYQCCTDAGQCYAPETAQAVVSFFADTPNPPRDPGVSIAVDSQAGPRPAPGGNGASPPKPDASARATPQLTPDDWRENIPWQDWSPGWAEELSRRGHRVYVDYTATWCLTCQVNKKAVLETEPIRRRMAELGVIPIKADFTNRSPVMFEEIKKHGHNTVPLNLVYAAGQPDRPGILPAVLTQETVRQALDNPVALAAGGGRKSLVWMLVFGFIGGLILNVMPCVLPVISIKIVSFVQQAGEDPRRVFRLGLAFCAGIMVWFWLFAALSATGNIPWQYPTVIIALASLIFVFALNLFGVFEVTLPGGAAGALDTLATREGYSGAFFKGLLATLLGTACTAPFLATALGYALTQPWWVGLALFTAAGVGMASPYLLLCAQPAWLKYVPKPGMWMITFKQGSAFLLLATSVWLLYILAAQLDGLAIVWTVAFWTFLALAVWMLGKIKPNWSTGSRYGMWAASTAVAVAGVYFCFVYMYDLNRAASFSDTPAAQVADSPGGRSVASR
ncbi:MAG: thioredoxin family protein [Phycisphaerae bacterium]|nr:thioredoxin family protein [Phycisphaerae bacterium]MCZ2399677.1 thioredoxin family protein [Phycisphaerae bacterium]NUQ50057.1 thioredoxin family protein [Phycisphaerae bacterium]